MPLAALPDGAFAAGCGGHVRGGGPSRWSVDAALGALDDGVLFTHGFDRVRGDAFDEPLSPAVQNTPYVNPDPGGCRRIAHGRGINFPTTTIDGIDVKPKLYFQAHRPVARTLVLLTNRGVSQRDIQFAYDGGPGSDGATRIGATSNGNRTAEAGDAWATTCEDQEGDGCAKTVGLDRDRDPELAHNWQRDAADVDGADVFELADGLDDYDVRFYLTIDPGETVAYMDAETLAPTIGRADRFARHAGLHPAKVGLFNAISARERGELRNW